jgi:hypothetical protein
LTTTLLTRFFLRLPLSRPLAAARFQASYWLLLVVAGISIGATRISASREPIVLHAAPLAFTPREFYVADVVDERRDRTAVAYLLPTPLPVGTPTLQPSDFQGGTRAAIQQFIRQSLPTKVCARSLFVCRSTSLPKRSCQGLPRKWKVG